MPIVDNVLALWRKARDPGGSGLLTRSSDPPEDREIVLHPRVGRQIIIAGLCDGWAKTRIIKGR